MCLVGGAQADLAVEKSKAAKQEAETVVAKAKTVAATSKNAIDIARRQRKAREVTTRATEKALRTFRWVVPFLFVEFLKCGLSSRGGGMCDSSFHGESDSMPRLIMVLFGVSLLGFYEKLFVEVSWLVN